ncbi:MAG: glycosyltransferase family 2 protein, partial [Deltaproteobacteria bacterium]|nr:glycosyltransferase family 2 protein [Deltaproteobacteria bacterium]
QGYPNLEYLVIDGGSTDNTVSILKKYEKHLRWASEKDKGQSDAINKGIQKAAGEIIAYLNSDDTYEPGALKKAASFFMEHPSIKWATGMCRIIDTEDREVRKPITRYKNFLLRRYSYNILLVTNFISQPATFLRKELFKEFGLFDVNQHRVMDYDYWLKAGKLHKPGFIDDYLACFRVHQGSKTSSSFKDTFRQELDLARKYSDSRLINALHYASYLGICGIYAILDRAGRKGRPVL